MSLVIEDILNVYASPFAVFGRVLFESKKGRIATLFTVCISAILSLGTLLFTLFTVHEKEQRDYILNNILPFFISPILFVTIIFIFYLLSKVSNNLDIQLDKIREERVEITQKIEHEKELDIFHTIQLSLNQLNEYYTINKGQARSSFRFSIASIVIGIITIVSGVWLFYFDKGNVQLASISGVSGVLLEFIGGAYFFMYKKSLEQVNFFFGQLIRVQDTMLSINLANNITVEHKKVEMQEKIIISLLERSLK